MDFTLTPEQTAFGERVRAWLKANIPEDWTKLGLSEVPRPEAYAFLRKWQATLYAPAARVESVIVGFPVLLWHDPD